MYIPPGILGNDREAWAPIEAFFARAFKRAAQGLALLRRTPAQKPENPRKNLKL